MRPAVIVSIVNSKGGVGKSTLTVHAAVWLLERGLRVAVVDADAIGASTRWLTRAEPRIPVYAFVHAADILDQLPRLLDQFDAIVADGPAALAAETAALVSVADVALLPVGASMIDVHASYRTALLISNVRLHPKRAGLPLAFAVLNRVQNRARLPRVAAEAVVKYCFPVAGTPLAHHPALVDACCAGTVVSRMGARARDAAAELDALFAEVLDLDRVRAARGQAARVRPPAEATLTLAAPRGVGAPLITPNKDGARLGGQSSSPALAARQSATTASQQPASM